MDWQQYRNMDPVQARQQYGLFKPAPQINPNATPLFQLPTQGSGGRSYLATNQLGQQEWARPGQLPFMPQRPAAQPMQLAQGPAMGRQAPWRGPGPMSAAEAAQDERRADGGRIANPSPYTPGTPEYTNWKMAQVAKQQQDAQARIEQVDEDTLARKDTYYQDYFKDGRWQQDLDQLNSNMDAIGDANKWRMAVQDSANPGTEGYQYWQDLLESSRRNPNFANLPLAQQEALLLNSSKNSANNPDSQQNWYDNRRTMLESQLTRMRDFYKQNPARLGALSPEDRKILGLDQNGSDLPGWSFTNLFNTNNGRVLLGEAPDLTAELLGNQRERLSASGLPGMLS